MSDATKGQVVKAALAYCNIPSTVSTCITQSFTATCSSRAHSLETTFQRLPCPRVLAPCGCQEVFRWDLEKRRRSHYSLLSSCRQARGHRQMAEMWMSQQLAGHPLKPTHTAATSYGDRQQQTLREPCNLWSPSKLLCDSCFPDFLKASSSLPDLYSHAPLFKGFWKLSVPYINSLSD